MRSGQINMMTSMTKEETAIQLLRAVEPPEGFYLAFSGGKDSVVIHHLATRAGVKFDAHYCVSPIDPKEIHQFIRQHYPDVQWDNHIRARGTTWWALVVKKGLPMRQSRWCCELIKEAGGNDRVLIVGNRRAEGTIRKKQLCFEAHHNPKVKKIFVRPILDWTDTEVWDYIYRNNLPSCSLYKEGFHRLGCVLCPFARNVKKELHYFPKIAYLWRRACDQIIAKRQASGKTFKREFATGQELWDWWLIREK